MKLRRLPETDLARIAPLGLDEKWRALRSFNSGGGSWSYDPARSQNFNIANPASPLGLDPCRPSMEKIRQLVSRRCSYEKQEQSCLEVVDLFADWYQEAAIGAVEFNIPSMAIGSLGAVRYWENFFARIGERNSFFFFDYRRANGLTAVARKFVFSMMHQQIRLSNPDFFDADLIILRFPQSKKFRRISAVHVAENDLYSFAELSKMIDETYFIWLEVLSERKAAEPRRSVGGMFG